MKQFKLLKAGVNIKAVFWLCITFSTQISRSRFMQSRISLLIPHIYVLGRKYFGDLLIYLEINSFYIKACYRPKTVAHPLARALLEYSVTCNYTRLLTQTTVLDKSGHDCGKFNHIKCNRIPTQRSIQKLFRSN